MRRKEVKVEKSKPQKGQTIRKEISAVEHLKSLSTERKRVQQRRACNSYYGQRLNPTLRKILKEVEKSQFPIKPLEIAQKAGIKHSTVRVSLRRLFHMGFLDQPYYGSYQKQTNVVTLDPRGLGVLQYGSGELKPHVHSLQFTVRDVKGNIAEFLEPIAFSDGLVKISFYSHSNGTVVVYVAGEFDAIGFPLLIEFLKHKLGVSEGQIVPKQCEFNNDLDGLQLEGAKCLTIRGIQGELIRLYNKDKKTLRHEVKPVRAPRSVAEIQALLQGGMTPYYILQSVGMLISENRRLVDAVKFGNRTQAEFVRLLKALVDRLLRALPEESNSQQAGVIHGEG